VKQTLRLFVEIWDRLKIVGKQILEDLDAKRLKGFEKIKPSHLNEENVDRYRVKKNCCVEKEVAYGDGGCNPGK
jgi:hypothetical protein